MPCWVHFSSLRDKRIYETRRTRAWPMIKEYMLRNDSIFLSIRIMTFCKALSWHCWRGWCHSRTSGNPPLGVSLPPSSHSHPQTATCARLALSHESVSFKSYQSWEGGKKRGERKFNFRKDTLWKTNISYLSQLGDSRKCSACIRGVEGCSRWLSQCAWRKQTQLLLATHDIARKPVCILHPSSCLELWLKWLWKRYVISFYFFHFNFFTIIIFSLFRVPFWFALAWLVCLFVWCSMLILVSPNLMYSV